MSDQAMEPLAKVELPKIDDDFENREATWEDLEKALDADAEAADKVFKAKTMLELLDRMEEFFHCISHMSKVYESYYKYIRRLTRKRQAEDDTEEEEMEVVEENNEENHSRG